MATPMSAARRCREFVRAVSVVPFLGLALIVLVAACGGSGQPAGSTQVTLSEYKFDPSRLSAKPGKVEFYLVNSGTTTHDMVIADSSGKVVAKSDQVQAGGSKTFSIDNLAAGSYQVYCDLPGHKESGMVGTLTVT
jgi:plastocyanin